MKRYNFYFRQLLRETELDNAFEASEQADRDIVAELLPYGVLSGLAVTQAAPTANLTVSVSAGKAYDAAGQRVAVANTQTVNLAVDSNGVSTSVGNVGNAKVVSIFLAFARALSDPKTDGNSETVYYLEEEGFAFVVRQGSEAVAGTETAPALEPDKILLADIQRTFGQTQILNAAINSYADNRRQDALVGTSGLLEWRVGTLKAAVDLLRGAFNDTIITPPSFSGNQDNYNPTGFDTSTLVRQALTGAGALRGLMARKAGTRIRLLNISTATNTLTINHEDANSSAANRFICPNLANFTVRAGGGVDLWYDGTSSRWRVLAL